MSESSLTARDVVEALRKHHTQDVFFSEVKTGATWGAIPGGLQRLDGIAMKKSWAHPCITGYEVKVARNDFLRDEKWPQYRDVCHRLYFACPKGLIKPEELADDVGLIYINPETKAVTTRKAARYRDIELPTDLLYYLIICRLDNSRDDSVSRRMLIDDLRAYAEGKKDFKAMGCQIASRLAEDMRRVSDENKDLKHRMEGVEEREARVDRLQDALHEMGIWLGSEPERAAREIKMRMTGLSSLEVAQFERGLTSLESALNMLRHVFSEVAPAKEAVGQ